MAGKKKKGLDLLDALTLIEATTSKGYPDGGEGVAGDDDRPPGNIVYGEKYKKVPYDNRLTSFQKAWGVDLSDWKWDEFENSMGMEDRDNYSDTIQGMKDLFPDLTWKNIWSKMKEVPDAVTTKRFKDAGQPWRKGGEDQLSDIDDEQPYVEIDAKDDGAEFKDSKVKGKMKTESILDKIHNITI